MVIGKWLLVIGSVTPAVLCLLSSVFCPRPSTTVERALQISLFMQNKANFPDDQMNVNKVLIKDYENNSNCKLCENKANSKPNKANLLKAKMNVNFYSTKDYENISNWAICENKPNTKPIQTQSKPISEEKNAAAFDD